MNVISNEKISAGDLKELKKLIDGMGFQIKNSRFPGSWGIMLELKDFNGEKPPVVFPENAGKTDFSGWLTVIFK